jgi:hypothetical protein
MKKISILALSLFAGVLGGCLSSRPVSDGGGGGQAQGVPLGAFAASSPALGTRTVAPTGCTSGDPEFFLGADFADASSGLVLRLVVDPIRGPAVRLFSAGSPFDNDIVFTRAECAVFHFSLDSTGWRVNRVSDYRVTLELDCSRDGESIRGHSSSTHCH